MPREGDTVDLDFDVRVGPAALWTGGARACEPFTPGCSVQCKMCCYSGDLRGGGSSPSADLRKRERRWFLSYIANTFHRLTGLQEYNQERVRSMNRTNPKFCLRNYMAQVHSQYASSLSSPFLLNLSCIACPHLLAFFLYFSVYHCCSAVFLFCLSFPTTAVCQMLCYYLLIKCCNMYIDNGIANTMPTTPVRVRLRRRR